MRHHKVNRKFGRVKNQRTALMKGLILSLLEKERITTTEAKAKELRPAVEKIITFAKQDTLAKRRIVLAKLYNQTDMVKKVFGELAPKYKERNGGYTRVLKIPQRLSDSSKMAIIEFV